MVEQGVALAMNGVVQRDDIIPPEIQLARWHGERATPAVQRPSAEEPPAQEVRSLQDVVDDAERRAIEATLREVDGNKERAADLLGLSSTTLWRKMKRLSVIWPS